MNHTLAKDVEWLVSHVSSLKKVLPSFTMAGAMLSSRAHESLQKIFESHASNKVYDDSGNLKQFIIDGNYRSRYRKVRRHYENYAIFTKLLPNMTLVSLVSVYDAFLRRLLRNLFLINPEILNGCGRQITFAELTEFGSIDAAREYVIEQEIDTLLRDSHASQILWLENKLKVKLTEFPSWKHFIEITERRNLLVHAEGIVSRQYLSACKKAGYTVPNDCTLGATLQIDPDYFSKACDYIAEIAIKLNQVIWRKILPGQLEAAEDSFVDTTYSLLSAGEYHLTELLLTFAQTPAFKKFNAESNLYLNINLAIALKGQEKEEECKALISSIDCSALADKFKLASAVLLEDYQEAAKLIRKIGADGEIGPEQYKQWPLFAWFRKTDQFKELYKEVFGMPFASDEKVEIGDMLLDDEEPDNLPPETSEAESGQHDCVDEGSTRILDWETADEENQVTA